MTAFVAPIALHARRTAPLSALPSSVTALRPPRTSKKQRVAAPRMHAAASPSSSSSSASAGGGSDGATAAPLVVMVNGVPGRMAAATADAVAARGFVLAEEALTGPGMESTHVVESESGSSAASIQLAGPDGHEAALRRMVDKHPGLIVVDYTHPSAANHNVDLYVACGASFVIGTTGGDADAMRAAVESQRAVDAGVLAVIAPNMGKQIVAFQAIMEMMSSQFPGAFAGYNLSVKESHQSTKADTSGTAKAVVASMNKLGLDFNVDQIDKLRDKKRSMTELHVPERYIDEGHAFHTYDISSPDGTVHFEFQHNVCGRNFYAEGTVDAVNFLHAQRHAATPPEKRVFTMIDILRTGTMS